MAPPKNSVRTISQEAFDELVKENIDDLGMDPDEALSDAVETLTLQGVDLSGIITCGVEESPVIQCLETLKGLEGSFEDHRNSVNDLDSIEQCCAKLAELCREEGSGNAAVATRNGAVRLVCSLCSMIRSVDHGKALASALKAMTNLLHDLQSTEAFRASDGPSIVVGVLNESTQNLEILESGFAVVAAAATGNEVLKESFVELKIEELILQVLSIHDDGSVQSLYDAIRVLLTPDDNRVVASQVYGYARKFAKIGIAGALVGSLQAELSSPSLVSASIALKAVAVNEEICKSIADNGGIDAVLRSIDESSEQGNNTVARVCCSLLSKLAGSDANKNAIVEKRGLDRLIKLSARFSDDPSVLLEIMSIISILCLRLPEIAARAVEAGAGDVAIHAMQKFPAAQLMQRNACFMIRNLVVRNPENRTILLNNGVEKHIRRAKQNHESCKEAATDALRDLGLDNYNL